MDKVNNPHDKFFKELMSDKERASNLLQAFLPENLTKQLDFATLEQLEGGFTSKELQEYFSDVVFRLSIKNGNSCYLSILLEHKSYKDEFVSLQLLTYLGAAYHQQLKNKEPLTLILPVIYYHGNENWDLKGIEHHFSDYSADFIEYLPQFKMEFIDLASLSDIDLMGLAGNMLSTPLLLQKYAGNPKELEKQIVRILSTISPHLKKSFLTTIFVYTTQLIELKEEEVIQVLNNLSNPIREEFMSTYEILLDKGRKQGIEQNTLSTAETCYEEGLSIKLTARIANLSLEEVKAIFKKLDQNKK